MSRLSGYFVAPDADEELWLWRERGNYPLPILSRHELRNDPDVWDLIVATTRQRAHLMTAEHAHGIDTGGEVETVLAGHVYEDFLGGLSEVWTTCTCGEKIDATFGGGRTCAEVFRANWAAHIAAALDAVTITRASAADAVLAEARQLCCGENPSTHHAASAKHSELMAFAGDLARAVRGA